MNRRDVLVSCVGTVIGAVPGLPALPEVTLPRTAEERLVEAVSRWLEADAALANLTRTYESARQLIWSGMAQHVPARSLKAMVESRQQARDEMAAGQRALADAETRMETAARLATGVQGGRGIDRG